MDQRNTYGQNILQMLEIYTEQDMATENLQATFQMIILSKKASECVNVVYLKKKKAT